MSFVEKCLSQRKLVLTLAGMLALLGVLAWATMIRQEDPRLPDYFGQVQAFFPGADAETVERLVLEPIEEHLAEVDEVVWIESTANAELAVLSIDLQEGLADTDQGWDRVREALAEAAREFPAGVEPPILDDRVIDTDAVVYGIKGSTDPLILGAAADELKDALLGVPGVAEVSLIADPGEEIAIEFDDSAARRLGLTPGSLAAQLGRRSLILPGGSLRLGDQTVRLRPQTDFESLEEIRRTPIALPTGDTVPLASVATVRRGPEEPARYRARHQDEPMVGLGVVPRRDINLVAFGEAVRKRVEAFAPTLAPLEVVEIAFQPDRVATRLSDLGRSLLLGAAIVALVLILAMGPRLGLVVTAIVPLVALSSLAIYNIGGGVLHQISIAALVIALGMLVDNGIVVTEAIQWGLDRGESAADAARDAVRELAIPLAGATATTLAAFVPMLLSKSTTGDFTRAIPKVIMLTLVVSFVYAMLVTPILGQLFLKPRKAAHDSRSRRLARWVGQLAVSRPVTILVLALLAVGISFTAAGLVRQEFFPGSDRNQFVVEMRLPEGSHLDSMDSVSRRLERSLTELDEVASVTAFIGRSAPRFYYNVDQIPWSPHFGQILVETTTADNVDEVIAQARELAHRDLPEAEEMVVRELRATPGAIDVRHTLSTGAPVLRFDVDDAAAARRGLSRADVAQALYGRTRGLVVGQFRAGDDPVPVLLRSSAGEDLPVSDLPAVDVSAPTAPPVALGQVARLEVEWRPAAIEHYQRRRTASVLSQLDEGFTYGQVIADVSPRLDRLELPEGLEIAVGGQAQESGAANAAIVRMVPIGMLLLLGVLLAEFRSFRRVGIVLVTVPLAAAGVVPGLLFGNQPFGFMSTLGIVALVGVVVNNAIVLLEAIETGRRRGADVPTALTEAVERRMRPILLTTATTVAGLLPLALSSSSLWPPMAWAMISGLTASTLLTLLVVPAIYLMLFSPRSRPRARALRPAKATAALTILALMAPAASMAAASASVSQEAIADEAHAMGAASATRRVTLDQAMAMGAERSEVAAAEQRATAAGFAATAEKRAGWWPSILAGAAVSERDRTLDLVTPIGNFPLRASTNEEAELALVQPLLAPAQQLYRTPAAETEAQAAALSAERTRQAAASAAAEAFLDVLVLDAALASTESLIDSLEVNLEETEAKVAEGRTLGSEALKVQLALESSQQERLALSERRGAATLALGRALGLDDSAEPIWDGERESPPQPAYEEAVAVALEQRQDLASLRESIAALELRRKGVRAERWPTLQARAAWVLSTGSGFEQEEWVEGAIQMAWKPFASGTRAPRASALESERLALESDYLEAERGVRLEVKSSLANLETAHGALSVSIRGVEQATETLRVERERFRAGRITTNDLLQAEAVLRSQRTRRDVAALQIVRAHVRLALAQGIEVTEALGSTARPGS
jgi:multidrug efflux pump subunit AcrB/outer membrane protein TolC